MQQQITIMEQETVCANCAHFKQHYISWETYPGGWYPINFGHCARPRVKDRRPGDTACYKFEQKGA